MRDDSLDEIRIDNIKVFGHTGVLPSEKENGQFFYVSLRMYLFLGEAGREDDLSKTVNYAEVCQKVYEIVSGERCDLIETLAERIADRMLSDYDRINGIEVTVNKPQAPVEVEFENIAVRIRRKRHRVYIGCGSNVGDGQQTIESALGALEAEGICRILKKSSYVVSTPYGGVEQDNFTNSVVLAETVLEPEDFLIKLHYIEKIFGRKRDIHWGPRTLDLDILLFDNMEYLSDNLIIPHKDMANRDFVLGPLAEIAGTKIHPVYKKSIDEMLEEIKEKHIVDTNEAL